MDQLIRTARLVLRRARADDAPAMHRLMSDPRAMHYWSTLPHERLEQTEVWITSMIDVSPQESDDFIMTLEGRLIGKLGCWKLPEIGFLLDPELWGRGYASEALIAFIERRRSLGSAELLADVDPQNHLSLRLLQRAGFVETRRAARSWHIGGVWHDSVYLRLEL